MGLSRSFLISIILGVILAFGAAWSLASGISEDHLEVGFSESMDTEPVFHTIYIRGVGYRTVEYPPGWEPMEDWHCALYDLIVYFFDRNYKIRFYPDTTYIITPNKESISIHDETIHWTLRAFGAFNHYTRSYLPNDYITLIGLSDILPDDFCYCISCEFWGLTENSDEQK
ncbi:MAG: hypothetical protein LBE55_05145 [Clostridiales bacterium]|jgi:hypothetical protein|nr:hypothetical protein [Clostridiales bacterium]